jgi:hypothetical protein
MFGMPKRRHILRGPFQRQILFRFTYKTTFGVNSNDYYLNNVQNQLKMDVLFERM